MLSMNRRTIRNIRTISIGLSASLVAAVASSPALAMVTQDEIDRGMPESGSQIGHVNLGKPGRVILEPEPRTEPLDYEPIGGRVGRLPVDKER